MPTVITTPATLWVVPTLVRVTVGQVDAADACNVLDVPGEADLVATCQDQVFQDEEDET